MLFHYFGYIIPFNIKVVILSIFQIHNVPYITSFFYYFGDIIPFNIKLANMSIFQIQKVCHIIKFNIYVVTKNVFQSLEFHHTHSLMELSPS
jgi:hypothetical protein